MKSSWLSDASICMATYSDPFYAGSGITAHTVKEIEYRTKKLYEDRLIELEKENFALKQRSPIGMAQQFVPGQIIPNINVNDWYYNQNTMMYEQKCTNAPVKKDIKSLIAYYYNR